MKYLYKIVIFVLAGSALTLDFRDYPSQESFVLYDGTGKYCTACDSLVFRNTDKENLSLFGKYMLKVDGKDGTAMGIQVALLLSGNLSILFELKGRTFCINDQSKVTVFFNKDSCDLITKNGDNCAGRAIIYSDKNPFSKLFTNEIKRIKVYAVKDSLEVILSKKHAELFRLQLNCLKRILDKDNNI